MVGEYLYEFCMGWGGVIITGLSSMVDLPSAIHRTSRRIEYARPTTWAKRIGLLKHNSGGLNAHLLYEAQDASNCQRCPRASGERLLFYPCAYTRMNAYALDHLPVSQLVSVDVIAAIKKR